MAMFVQRSRPYFLTSFHEVKACVGQTLKKDVLQFWGVPVLSCSDCVGSSVSWRPVALEIVLQRHLSCSVCVCIGCLVDGSLTQLAAFPKVQHCALERLLVYELCIL